MQVAADASVWQVTRRCYTLNETMKLSVESSDSTGSQPNGTYKYDYFDVDYDIESPVLPDSRCADVVEP